MVHGGHLPSTSTAPCCSPTPSDRSAQRPATKQSGERPSVSWPVQPCPTRTTSTCDLRATWRLDFASPRSPPRIEFDPRVCCQRFHHVAHATRSPGCPSPASPPRSFPATRSPPRTTDHPSQADNSNPITQGGIPWQPEGCQGSPPPSRRAQVWGTLCTISKHLCRSKLSAQSSACKPPLTSATQPLKTFARNRYRQPFTPKRLPQTPSPKTNPSTFPHQGLYTRIMSLNSSNQSPMSRNHHSVTSADFTCPAKPPKLLETR